MRLKFFESPYLIRISSLPVLASRLSERTQTFIVNEDLKAREGGWTTDYIEFHDLAQLISHNMIARNSSATIVDQRELARDIREENETYRNTCCRNMACMPGSPRLGADDNAGKSSLLHIIFLNYKTKLRSKLRIRHVPEILTRANISYDVERVPESVWTLHSDNVLDTYADFLTFSNRITL